MKQFVSFSVLALLVFSCSKEIDKSTQGPPISQITISGLNDANTLNISSIATDTISFQVKCAGPWNVSLLNGSEWLNLITTSGADSATVYLKPVTRNFSAKRRTATLEVSTTSGSPQTLSIRVSQASYTEVPWHRSYGNTADEELVSVAIDMDGNLISTGYRMNNGREDVLLIKVDPSGDTVWTKTFGGTLSDVGTKVIASSDSCYMLALRSNSIDGEFPSTSGMDPWLVKLNGDGHIIWKKSYPTFDYDNFSSMFQTQDGGYMLLGWSGSVDREIKVDVLGNIEWDRTSGNYGVTLPMDGFQATDGSFIICGLSNPVANGQFWISKIDVLGNTVWNKTYDDKGDDIATDIIGSPDGGVLVVGSSYTIPGLTEGINYGKRDVWVLKLNADGDMLWERAYGSSEDEKANAVVQFPGGGYVIAGYTEGNDHNVWGPKGGRDGWIIKLNEIGNFNWQKTFGGSGDDTVFDLVYSGDEYFTFVGSSTSTDQDMAQNNGGKDGWMFKTRLQ